MSAAGEWPMQKIFISYRQEDAKPWALLLRDELATAFGEEHVFFDKDTLRSGNWRAQISEALERCRVVMVVMGRRWLTIADESGRRRLDDTADLHRHEIALALSLDHVTLIPVRVDGTAMPRAEELPQDIRSLTEQQSYEISDSRVRRAADLKLLMTDITRLTGLKTRANLPGKQDVFFSAKRNQWLGKSVKNLLAGLAASIAVLVAAEIVLGWTFGPSEIWLIVLICLGITIFTARLRTRWKERNNDVRT
jgi:hypothetical protein